jgi:cysteine desulfurase
VNRVYLDWNATAPLRPEARGAMLAAMDAAGNPSSVHGEGRAAKAIIEKARGQVAALVGCEPGEVVFTSGATEAATTAITGHNGPVLISAASHDCLAIHANTPGHELLEVDRNGQLRQGPTHSAIEARRAEGRCLLAFSLANGETGVIESDMLRRIALDGACAHFADIAQIAGRRPFRFDEPWNAYGALSAHKLRGPKGVGALLVREGFDLPPLITGGGQETGRRSGTENLIGIAGFGAAAEAARHDLENGVWEQVAKLRDGLEDRLEAAAPDLHVFGKDAPRLPNTSYFAVPGWKGETQVMQMDLSGFAVSAGSACSSGKVDKASRVLLAMGYDEETAGSAIRVSMGPTTTEAEVMAFADTWIEHYHRRRARAA